MKKAMFKFFIEKINFLLVAMANRSPTRAQTFIIIILFVCALVGFLLGRFTTIFDYLLIAAAFLAGFLNFYMDIIIKWTFLFFIIFCVCKLLSKLPYRVLNVLQYVIPFIPFIVVYYLKSLDTLYALEGEQDPKPTNEDPSKNKPEKLEGSENIIPLFNNFIIIIMFYIVFFLPIFYNYVKEDILNTIDLEPEMKYIIRQKRKYKRNYNFYDIFIILIFFSVFMNPFPVLGIPILSTEFKCFGILILGMVLFFLKNHRVAFNPRKRIILEKDNILSPITHFLLKISQISFIIIILIGSVFYTWTTTFDLLSMYNVLLSTEC